MRTEKSHVKYDIRYLDGHIIWSIVPVSNSGLSLSKLGYQVMLRGEGGARKHEVGGGGGNLIFTSTKIEWLNMF